jgi:phosphoglycerate kinase
MTTTQRARLSVRDLDVRGRRVLVRCDFNVPLDGGEVADATRIEASLPTILSLQARGARIVLMSHLGRPEGKKDPSMSLKPVARALSEKIGSLVRLAPDCVGEETEKLVSQLRDGDILLLENLRFHKEETKNDPAFAKKVARLGDLYVNDAFGTAHRAHASTEGVAKLLEKAAAGFLLEKELEYLEKATSNPARPYVAILGGAKISGKIDVIENLFQKVDSILLGGAMACTFFRAKGFETGDSLVEEDRVEMARKILERAQRERVKLELPLDCVVARELSETSETRTVKANAIPKGWRMLDIGPETLAAFRESTLRARTVLWNGPMGVFEIAPFVAGTFGVARALADATKRGAVTIVGGGDSAAAIAKAGLQDSVSHVSTGGGASLEFLEGKELPGVAVLSEASG